MEATNPIKEAYAYLRYQANNFFLPAYVLCAEALWQFDSFEEASECLAFAQATAIRRPEVVQLPPAEDGPNGPYAGDRYTPAGLIQNAPVVERLALLVRTHRQHTGPASAALLDAVAGLTPDARDAFPLRPSPDQLQASRRQAQIRLTQSLAHCFAFIGPSSTASGRRRPAAAAPMSSSSRPGDGAPATNRLGLRPILTAKRLRTIAPASTQTSILSFARPAAVESPDADPQAAGGSEVGEDTAVSPSLALAPGGSNYLDQLTSETILQIAAWLSTSDRQNLVRAYPQFEQLIEGHFSDPRFFCFNDERSKAIFRQKSNWIQRVSIPNTITRISLSNTIGKWVLQCLQASRPNLVHLEEIDVSDLRATELELGDILLRLVRTSGSPNGKLRVLNANNTDLSLSVLSELATAAGGSLTKLSIRRCPIIFSTLEVDDRWHHIRKSGFLRNLRDLDVSSNNNAKDGHLQNFLRPYRQEDGTLISHLERLVIFQCFRISLRVLLWFALPQCQYSLQEVCITPKDSMTNSPPLEDLSDVIACTQNTLSQIWISCCLAANPSLLQAIGTYLGPRVNLTGVVSANSSPTSIPRPLDSTGMPFFKFLSVLALQNARFCNDETLPVLAPALHLLTKLIINDATFTKVGLRRTILDVHRHAVQTMERLQHMDMVNMRGLPRSDIHAKGFVLFPNLEQLDFKSCAGFCDESMHLMFGLTLAEDGQRLPIIPGLATNGHNSPLPQLVDVNLNQTPITMAGVRVLASRQRSCLQRLALMFLHPCSDPTRTISIDRVRSAVGPGCKILLDNVDDDD